MQLKKPWSPRLVVCLASLIPGMPVASLRGQEYAPVVDGRYETSLEQPVGLAEDENDPKGGWDLGAVISAAYDDNIFLSATDPKSDHVLKVAPTVAYSKGDENEQVTEGAFLKAGYRPSFVFYADNHDENRTDHEALATAGWRGKVTRVIYTGALRKLGDATSETGRPTDRLEFANEIRAAWIARDKITLEVAAGDRQQDYADPGFFDSRKNYGEVAFRYAYSPKTQLGLSYQIGRFKVDGTGPQDTHEVAASMAWQPREKIRVDVKAGAEHRSFDNGSSVNPVLEGRVEWSPRQGTGIFATAYAREEASAFYAGQNYSVRGVTAGVSQRLGEKWTGKLEAGMESNRYEQVSGSGAAGRKDRILFIRPALVRKIGEKSELSLFYRMSDNNSSDKSFGYDQQMIGLEFNHKF